MFRETEGSKVGEIIFLATALNDDDEVKFYFQICSGARDTSGPVSSMNPTIY